MNRATNKTFRREEWVYLCRNGRALVYKWEESFCHLIIFLLDILLLYLLYRHGSLQCPEALVDVI